MSAEYCLCSCGLPGCASRHAQSRGSHGTKGAYNYGCRCAKCKRANTVKTGIQRKRRNDKSRDRAERNGQPWTGPDLEIATRPGLTAAEAAEMLGRTMQAVKNVRVKCQHDPKFVSLLGEARDRLDP